jgi:WD40 repeat protein
MESVIRVYNAADYSFLCKLECDSEVVTFDWHATGRAIIAGCTDNTSWLFKVPSGRMASIFWGHSQPVTCAMFSEDRVVTAAEDGKVIVWRPSTAENLITYDSADARFAQGSILSLDLRFDNQLGACGSADRTARMFHLHSQKAK